MKMGQFVFSISINSINDMYKITMIGNISIQSNIKIGKGKGFNGEDIGKIQISSKKLTELIGQNVPVTVTLTVGDKDEAERGEMGILDNPDGSEEI